MSGLIFKRIALKQFCLNQEPVKIIKNKNIFIGLHVQYDNSPKEFGVVFTKPIVKQIRYIHTLSWFALI